MSGGLDVLAIQDDDITKMLAATTHIGSENSETTMAQYVYKRRADGINIINIKKFWEKLLLAARAIVAIENASDVFVVSSRPSGQRAVLKCASYIGATAVAGRFTPGAFTNQIQAAFREPRLLVIADPRADHQPITEGSYANIPIIAFCNADSPTRFVDIVIPCNNKSEHSIGLVWWFLTREVLRLKSVIARSQPWDVMPDLFFYRDPEDAEKQEEALKEAAEQAKQAAAALVAKTEDWDAGAPEATDWAAEGLKPVAPAAGAAAAPAATGAFVSDDWQTPASTDWAAAEPAAAPQPGAQAAEQWGGSSNW